MASLNIRLAALHEAPLVRRIMLESFATLEGVLDPPSSSHLESVEDVRRAMERGGALLAWIADTPVATARFIRHPDWLYVERVGVLPDYRRRGIARALMLSMDDLARQSGVRSLEVGVRLSLPSNIALFRAMGYDVVETTQHPRGPDTIARLIKNLEHPHVSQ